MSENEASRNDEAAQTPQGGEFKGPTNKALQRRIKRLKDKLAHEEKLLDSFAQDWNAVCKQLGYPIDADDCNKLERKLEAYEEGIDKTLECYGETAGKLAALTGQPVEDKAEWREQRLARRPKRTTKIPHNLPRSGAAAFVGRDEEIETLHQQLQQSDRIAIAAIEGMGGIGKTELALQYAITHLQQQTYPGGLCWLQARDAEVGSQIVSFALSRLGLTLSDGLELQEQVGFCWSHWRDGEVLLVFDDVTDYKVVAPFLPPSDPRFKILFTTRLRIGKTVQELRLDVLSKAAATELLVQLVGKERIQGQLEDAKALCQWLGYLPLGLELVGRYLEGKPDLPLPEMQQRLEDKRLETRALVKTEAGMTGTLGVAAAFELSWQELSEAAQQLGALLSLFALAPIPWLLVESVVNELGDEVLVPSDVEELEELRDGVLLKRHLLQRVGEGTYQLHQLIREFFAVKREPLEAVKVLKQGYCRAMVKVAKTIPWPPIRNQIVKVAPSIPHLEEATVLSEWLSDEDLYSPFEGISHFWYGQGAYAQAQLWNEQCLSVVRDRLGEDHPYTAGSLNNLAELYRSQGRYSEAEPLYLQALEIDKRALGEDHPDTAIDFNNLALLYRAQGRYEEAEPLYKQALDITRQQLGENHPHTAVNLGNLAGVYESQGRYEEAEPLRMQALNIHQQQLGEDHPLTATSLNNLAVLYKSQGRYSEAEPLYLQALKIRQQQLGEDHPDTAISLNNLAELYRLQGRYVEAEPLYLQTLEIFRQQLGEDHPLTATSLNNLAVLYKSQGRYSEAEPLFQKALEIKLRVLGEEHPSTVITRNHLDRLRAQQ